MMIEPTHDDGDAVVLNGAPRVLLVRERWYGWATRL
jgi:hypothetical protein